MRAAEALLMTQVQYSEVQAKEAPKELVELTILAARSHRMTNRKA